MLGYRLDEKNWSGITVKERGKLAVKSHIQYITFVVAGVEKPGATGGRCLGWPYSSPYPYPYLYMAPKRASESQNLF
jgi:hypothetical protein